MNWRYKARLQSILSRLPGGSELDYMMKRYVTRTVPASHSTFAMDVRFAQEHLRALVERGPVAIEDAQFFEFGVGWDLTISQVYYCCGVNHQVVVDIRPLMKPGLVSDIARRLCASENEVHLMRIPGQLIRQIGYDECRNVLKELCGIDYRAPFDMRHTGLGEGAIDYITATKVLSHIPLHDLWLIIRECFRILRPGGLMRVLSNYRDEYANFDKNISVYNFLQFSDEEWRRYSTALLYQNRLRHCDYRSMFIKVGFEILEDQPGYDDSAEAVLRHLPLAPEFEHYSFEDLAPVRGVLMLRRPEAVHGIAASAHEDGDTVRTGRREENA